MIATILHLLPIIVVCVLLGAWLVNVLDMFD
jgi:hypothetical protein